MRTGRTLTVFRKLETPPKIWSRHPPKNLEQAPPPKIWSSRHPPRKFGAGTPPPPLPQKFGADTPHPPCEQNHTHVQKYYLGQNFVSAGNNLLTCQHVHWLIVSFKCAQRGAFVIWCLTSWPFLSPEVALCWTSWRKNIQNSLSL